jgi:hypothetical protein
MASRIARAIGRPIRVVLSQSGRKGATAQKIVCFSFRTTELLESVIAGIRFSSIA